MILLGRILDVFWLCLFGFGTGYFWNQARFWKGIAKEFHRQRDFLINVNRALFAGDVEAAASMFQKELARWSSNTRWGNDTKKPVQ